MAILINSETSGINVKNNFDINNKDLHTSLLKLSSGLRIPTAKDDVSGSGIADRMSSQVRGLSQYANNARDGILIARTAESAMQGGTDILQRMRELSVHSQNASLSDNDRANLQKEMNQLLDEYKNISNNTEFNGIKLLDGSYSDNYDSVNSEAQGVQIKIEIQDMRSLLNNDINISTMGQAEEAITKLDEAINNLADSRADMGSIQYSFEHNINELVNRVENLSKSKSDIADLDYTEELSQFNKTEILKQAGIVAREQTQTAYEATFRLLW